MRLKNKFIVVVPVFNQPHLILQCIESILVQKFDDIGIIIRNDCSTDLTLDCLITWLHKISIGSDKLVSWNGMSGDGNGTYTFHASGRDILVIDNKTKLYPCGNIYESVRDYVENDDAIIGTVDGDDRFIHSSALQIMYDEYQKGDIWIAWSQHENQNGIKGCSLPLVPDQQIQTNRYYWCASHFRTAKAWLYKKIDPTGLVDFFDKKSYIKMCGDAALLFPMLEMAGNEHAKFVDIILYQYNDDTGLNEHSKATVDMQHRYSHFIKFLPIYKKL